LGDSWDWKTDGTVTQPEGETWLFLKNYDMFEQVKEAGTGTAACTIDNTVNERVMPLSCAYKLH
jgi:hypothetical protein